MEPRPHGPETPDAADAPPDPQPPPAAESDGHRAPDGLDLLTVGLLVFFVSLIAIVGAMLLLPAVL